MGGLGSWEVTQFTVGKFKKMNIFWSVAMTVFTIDSN